MTRRHFSGRSLAFVALATLAAGGLLTACSGADPAADRERLAREARGDVVVGVAWPWGAHLDIRFGDGLQLALDEINAAGGVRGRKVRLVRGDDQGSVDGGRLAAHTFASDPAVVAVIGHLQSFVTINAASVYDAAGLVLFSPVTTDPALSEHGYKRFFRGTFTDDVVGTRMAEYAASRGYRRVAIYYVRDVYGRGLANAFERRAQALGIRVAARNSYEPSEQVTGRSFETTLHDWTKLDLDALFVAGELPAAANLVVQARRMGLTVPVLGGDAMSSADLLRIAGADAEGVVVASMFSPAEPRPAVRDFVTRFHQRFGAEPDAGAALGYDALRLLADAMRRAGTTQPDSIARALHATRAWTGATGVFTFDDNGDLQDRDVVKLVVQHGAFAYLPVASQLSQVSHLPAVSQVSPGTRMASGRTEP